MHRLLAALAFAVATVTAVTAPGGEPAAVVLANARIVDGSGKPPIARGAVVLRGDTIGAVVAGDVAHPPAGARIVDLHGKTIMPALIVAHAHLGLVDGASVASAHLTPANVERQLRKYARYGVGTVLSLGTDHDFIWDVRAARAAGKIPGAHLLSAGRGFGVPDGAPPATIGDAVYRPRTVAEVRADMDELAAHHPDLVKLWLDDFHGTMPKMKPEIYRAIIAEAHKHKLHVAAHVYYLDDAKALVAEGIDVLAHSVRDLPVDAELAGAMKERGVGLVPTLDLDESGFVYADKPAWMQQPFFTGALEPGTAAWLRRGYKPSPAERAALATAERNAKILYDAGVLLGFGTDSGAKPERIQGFAEHRELQLLVAAGLTPTAAIRVATADSAALLGIGARVGKVAPGLRADLLVVDGDPTTDIRATERIDSVWLDGKAVPLAEGE